MNFLCRNDKLLGANLFSLYLTFCGIYEFGGLNGMNY